MAPLNPRAFRNAAMNSALRVANSGSGCVRPESRCGYSSVHLRMNHATGLTSTAVASHPRRIASSGMAPPPANGSITRGARPPNVLRIFSRNQRNSSSLSPPQCNTPSAVSSFACSTTRPFTCLRSAFSTTRPAIRSRIAFRRSSLPESASSVAMSAARQAASGRLAGQIWSVEICPCRTFFSCTESSETCLSGKATSINRVKLHRMTFLVTGEYYVRSAIADHITSFICLTIRPNRLSNTAFPAFSSPRFAT